MKNISYDVETVAEILTGIPGLVISFEFWDNQEWTLSKHWYYEKLMEIVMLLWRGRFRPPLNKVVFKLVMVRGVRLLGDVQRSIDRESNFID